MALDDLEPMTAADMERARDLFLEVGKDPGSDDFFGQIALVEAEYDWRRVLMAAVILAGGTLRAEGVEAEFFGACLSAIAKEYAREESHGHAC